MYITISGKIFPKAILLAKIFNYGVGEKLLELQPWLGNIPEMFINIDIHRYHSPSLMRPIRSYPEQHVGKFSIPVEY